MDRIKLLKNPSEQMKGFLVDTVRILIGSFLVAMALNIFIVPSKIAPEGDRLIHHFVPCLWRHRTPGRYHDRIERPFVFGRIKAGKQKLYDQDLVCNAGIGRNNGRYRFLRGKGHRAVDGSGV